MPTSTTPGEVSEVFDNTVCTGCCAAGKIQYGNFTLVPGYPGDENSEESTG